MLAGGAVVLFGCGAAAPGATGWSAPQSWPVSENAIGRSAVAEDGSAALVTVSDQRTELRVTDTPGGRFGAPISLKPSSSLAIAAAPGGGVAVLAIRPGGLYSTVRSAAGEPWQTHKVAAEGNNPDVNNVTVAHDPLGGWVLAEARFSDGWTYLQTLSLTENGVPVGTPQSLGGGEFGSTARPTVALAVDAGGRAIFAPNAGGGRRSAGTSIFLRKHGEQFTRVALLGGGQTDARVAVGDGGRAAVVVTDPSICGEVGCRGVSKLYRVDAAGVVSAPQTVQRQNLKKTSGPAVAFLGGDDTIVSWTQRTAGDGFSVTGTVGIAAVNQSSVGEPGTLDGNDGASEPVVMSLSGGRALAVWAGGNNQIRGALINPAGEAKPTVMPAGPGPDPNHFNATNRDVHTAGSWAIVAWNTADFDSPGRQMVSLRRF